MARIEWDKPGERVFETGLSQGVLYPKTGSGVPWNGLVSLNDTPSGGELSHYYLDNVKYYIESTPTNYHGVLEAFTYPDEFSRILGSQSHNGLHYENQRPSFFGLSYVTLVGDDLVGDTLGYKIHLVYNVIVKTADSTNASKTNVVDAKNFRWELDAIPERIPGKIPTAHLYFDSTETPQYILDELERILYGDSSTYPRLPSVSEIEDISRYGERLEIQRKLNGLNTLGYRGLADLYGNLETGLLRKHPDSRLASSGKPGLSVLVV